MKFSSDILARLLAATGKGASRAALQAQDLDIAAQYIPILTPVGPLARFAGVVATDVQRETTAFSLNVATPPATGATVRAVLALGRGAWDITLTLDTDADFTPAVLTTLAAAQIQDPTGGAAVALIRHFAAANVPQHSAIRFPLVLSEDNWIIQLNSGVTAAAQNHNEQLSVYAARLL